MTTINAIFKAVQSSWSKETCYPLQREEWSESNPSIGQCAVTSLVVQDYFGGEIGYNSTFKHYWNIFPKSKIIDLTKDQFPRNSIIVLEKIVTRDYLLNSENAFRVETFKRYEILKNKVKNKLKKQFEQRNNPSLIKQ